MKTLLLIDGAVSAEKLSKLLGSSSDEIDLFPLISDWTYWNSLKETFNRGPRKLRLLPSAELIDHEVARIRERVSEWSRRIGEIPIRGKKLQDYFWIDQEEFSLYWLSLLSEKNPFKTDLFLQMAQLHAVSCQLEERVYDRCILALAPSALSEAFYEMLQKKKIHSVSIARQNAFTLPTVFVCATQALGVFFRLLYWSFIAKKEMGSLPERLPGSEEMLMISYFPYVEEEAALKGVFKNKYGIPLQEKLKEMNIPVVWLLMFVFIEGRSFRKAVELVKRFSNKGEKCFLWEEFLNGSTSFKIFGLWWKQAWKYLNVENELLKNPALIEGMTDRTSTPIIREALRRSFLGNASMHGIIAYHLFANALKVLPSSLRQCLYYCEMQSWEKALNAAARRYRPQMKRIAFQHNGVSLNFFPYFCDKTEFLNREETKFPFPDILAGNGKISRNLLSGSYSGNFREVEAVRQIYLANSFRSHYPKKNPVLLIVGSYSYKETKALLSLVHEAFPISRSFEIWLKGHPSCAMEKILEELNIDSQQAGYKIRTEKLSWQLSEARAVMVPTSTVAIEALAFDCEVIVPKFCDFLCMNPLIGFEDFYHEVFSPDDLRHQMELIFSTSSLTQKEKEAFVRDYWCLDSSLKKWESLILQLRN